MTNSIISRDPEILAGTPVFAGTRVPVRILFEHFEAGESLHDFLLDYPTVSQDQVIGVLELTIEKLDSEDDEAAA